MESVHFPLSENAAYGEFLAMQHAYGIDSESPMERFDLVSNLLTEQRMLLDGMDNDQILDAIAVTERKLFDKKLYATEDIDVDKGALAEALNGLVVAYLVQDESDLARIQRTLNINEKDWEIVQSNISERVLPYLAAVPKSNLALRQRLTEEMGPIDSDTLAEFIDEVNGTEIVNMIARKPIPDEQKAAIERRNDASEKIAGALFNAPFLTPDRALVLYKEGLEKPAEIAGVVAIGLINLTLCTAEKSLPLWQQALDHEDESVQRETLEMLDEILYGDTNALDVQMIEALGILYKQQS